MNLPFKKMMDNKSIKVQVELYRISGDTYPHRTILKKIGCVWNPNNKWWERYKPFKNEEREKIINLGLKIQHSEIDKAIVMTITPIHALKEENLLIEGCIGYVRELEPVRAFIRNDNTTGYFQRFVLVDQSGCIPCVSWNLVGSTELKKDRVVAIQKACLYKCGKNLG